MATFITLLLVPVIYAIFVLGLKIVKWETAAEHTTTGKALGAGTRERLVFIQQSADGFVRGVNYAFESL